MKEKINGTINSKKQIKRSLPIAFESLINILMTLVDTKFLTKRNIISSIIKIALAFILGYAPLGIIGVWLAYLIYGIVQKYMSKQRYEEIEGAKEK